MTVMSFTGSANFASNRPWADVILNPSHLGSPTHKCLVDTGADYAQLPASAVTSSGLSLASAVSITAHTAGGAASLLMLKAVQLDIEGYLVTIDILLDPTNSRVPLAGRNLLFAAFDLGMESTRWHWS